MSPKITPSRRERQRESRRSDILDAAQEIFNEVGYSNATMAQIASRAEFSVGTLYYFFPNKEGLFAEMILRRLEQSILNLRADLKSHKSWNIQLDLFIKHHLKVGQEVMPDILKTVEELFYSPSDIASESMERFTTIKHDALDILVGILTKAQQSGCAIKPDFMALVVMGTLNMVLDYSTIGILQQKPEDVIAQIKGLLI